MLGSRCQGHAPKIMREGIHHVRYNAHVSRRHFLGGIAGTAAAAILAACGGSSATNTPSAGSGSAATTAPTAAAGANPFGSPAAATPTKAAAAATTAPAATTASGSAAAPRCRHDRREWLGSGGNVRARRRLRHRQTDLLGRPDLLGRRQQSPDPDDQGLGHPEQDRRRCRDGQPERDQPEGRGGGHVQHDAGRARHGARSAPAPLQPEPTRAAR